MTGSSTSVSGGVAVYVIAVAGASSIYMAITSTYDIARARVRTLSSIRALTNAITITQAVDAFIQKQIFRDRNLSQLSQRLEQLSNQIPTHNASPSEWSQWANTLYWDFITGFDLTKEMLTLSQEDAEALREYLYITDLLIRCKDAATRVPKADWEAVEARLLTLDGPPES